MAFNKQQLVKDYEEAFGRNAALPIAFWHSDTPIAEPEKTGGCFIPVLEDARSLDAETMLCGGGKCYCGLAPLPAYVPTFVSEKEHYKANAELVEKAISQMDIQVSPYRYINFQRLDLMDEGIDYYGVLIFASPDVLSGHRLLRRSDICQPRCIERLGIMGILRQCLSGCRCSSLGKWLFCNDQGGHQGERADGKTVLHRFLRPVCASESKQKRVDVCHSEEPFGGNGRVYSRHMSV